MNIDDEYRSAVENYGKAEKKLAEAEADFRAIDSQVKTELAKAYAKTDSKGEDGKRASATTREMMSYFDPDYMIFQEAVETARREFLR